VKITCRLVPNQRAGKIIRLVSAHLRRHCPPTVRLTIFDEHEAEPFFEPPDGMGVRASARQLGVWPKTVRYWRKRWRTAADSQSVSERLADAPRSGAPATFTPEQICALVAMTCEKPSESERPISHWSQREIADEAMRRGLISNISQRSVGRFLKKKPTSSRIASAIG
jgi:transposase